jgi:hypothetical protein
MPILNLKQFTIRGANPVVSKTSQSVVALDVGAAQSLVKIERNFAVSPRVRRRDKAYES